jgi:hypothetical protein
MNLYLVFSHRLTDDQIRDARQSLGVTDFVALPETLQQRWSNIPASATLHEIKTLCVDILHWLMGCETALPHCGHRSAEKEQVTADSRRSVRPRLDKTANINAAHGGSDHAILIAGEPTAVLHLSLLANSAGLLVVQSTTERIVQERHLPDGTVIKESQFRHVQWRRVF